VGPRARHDFRSLLRRNLWNVRVWIGLGLVFVLLSGLAGSGPRSPLWFMELVLYGLMIAGLAANERYGLRKRIPLSRTWASASYILLVWLFGMMFEMSLTATGEGVGGVHQETIPSFILAQGDYIPIALVSYLVIRWFRTSFSETYFFAAGKSLTEGLLFTGVLSATILSPAFLLAPVVLAYYTLAYASFIATPLLFIDEELLWRKGAPRRRHSIPCYWVLGFALALGIRVFWGLVYAPLVSRLLDLPPGLVGE